MDWHLNHNIEHIPYQSKRWTQQQNLEHQSIPPKNKTNKEVKTKNILEILDIKVVISNKYKTRH